MERTERTVSELASLFRMLQVIPDADNVNKVYEVLLAFCTTWRTIGFERAFLLLVDSRGGVVRGHLAAENTGSPEETAAGASVDSFESLAKNVFESYEQIESSDITLRVRTFSVPIDWHRSAVIKAALSGYPVLAERRMSEFSTDPFFDFFASTCYIGVPVKVGKDVVAVLAADNGQTRSEISVDDVSLVYSLAQQAALAVERLLESADNKRKFRILRKLQEMLATSESEEGLREGLNLAMSMACRAVGASGCFMKDLVRKKTLHVKAVDEYTLEAGDEDISMGESFDDILDRVAGSMKPLHGDKNHALVGEVASGVLKFFYATPLAFAGEGLGAMAVYFERADTRRRRMEPNNRMFFDLCAGFIAERLSVLHLSHQVERADSMLAEVQSNLAREKESSRLGARAREHLEALAGEVEALKKAAKSFSSGDDQLALVRDTISSLDEKVALYQNELDSNRQVLRMVDLFGVVEAGAREWLAKVEDAGVSVDVKIPPAGPTLLMNERRITTAFKSILGALTPCVTEGDRVLIECSVSAEKAIVCVADTGKGLPGNLLSRLFMPFGGVRQDDEHKNALSMAGDILHQHSGEIMVKSSPSWKTILIVTFPLRANRDRRVKRSDRRRQRLDRRALSTARR